MSTVALLHFNGVDASTTILNSGGAATWAVGNQGQIDTGDKKFGSASFLAPSGGNDYAESTNIGNLLPASGGWTIDFWAKSGTSGFAQILMEYVKSSSNFGIKIAVDSSNNLVVSLSSDGATYDIASALVCGNISSVLSWNHIELVRDDSAGAYYVYLNGVSIETITTASQITNTLDRCRVGASSGGWIGWIDEFHIDNTVYHTGGGSFSVPTSEYADTSPQITTQIGTLTLVGAAPGIINPVLITPTVGALTLTGVANTGLYIGQLVVGVSGSLSLTGAAPDISRFITVPVGALTLTGGSGNIPVLITVPVGALSITGIASTGIVFETSSWMPWTATGLLIQGGLASSDGVSWAPWRSEGILTSPIVMSAEMAWAPWTAHATFKFSAAVEFAPWTVSGSLSELLRGSGSWAPWRKRNISGAPFWPAWTASARLQVTLSEVYTTMAMNTRNTAITEYTNYAFNSFAKIGNYYYGAGPNGLIRLSGATDNGSDIAWAVRTGQMAAEKTNLKRLIDVLVALRSNGPVRVRVHKDDSTYYDYMLPPIKPDTIHQHRVTPGKGMRSKYYMIELQGVNNADLELDSLLASMVETNRRLG